MQTHPAPTVARPAPRPDRPVALPVASETPETTLSGAAQAYGLGAASVDAALDRLPVALLLVDVDGRVVYANDAARRLRVGGVPALRAAASRAILDALVVHEEAAQRDADAPERRLAIDAAPVLGAGRVPLALVSVADVSASVRATQWAPIMESLMNL